MPAHIILCGANRIRWITIYILIAIAHRDYLQSMLKSAILQTSARSFTPPPCLQVSAFGHTPSPSLWTSFMDGPKVNILTCTEPTLLPAQSLHSYLHDAFCRWQKLFGNSLSIVYVRISTLRKLWLDQSQSQCHLSLCAWNTHSMLISILFKLVY